MTRTGRCLAVAAVAAVIWVAGLALSAGPEAKSLPIGTSAAVAAAQTTTTAAATTTTAVTGTPGADGLGDTFYPKMGNGGYHVKHYDIDIDVNPADNTISAVTTITATATQALSSFNLDFSGLTVTAITVNGKGATFSRSGTELTVAPAAHLAKGSEFTVAVTYSGSPAPISDPATAGTALSSLASGNKVGWHWLKNSTFPKGVVVATGKHNGAITWFPSNNHQSDKATYRFEITVPKTVVGVASGIRQSETTTGNYTTSVWKMEKKVATKSVSMYVGDFSRAEVRIAGQPLMRHYTHAGTVEPESLLPARSAVTSKAMALFQNLLGPHPFDAYGIIVVRQFNYALEGPSLSLHGRTALIDSIYAHELAHGWFGVSATPEHGSDAWLSEGSAMYLQWVYMHHAWNDSRSFDVMKYYVNKARNEVVASRAPAPKKITVGQILDKNAVYRRGALTMHALRKRAGDEVFWKIMKTAHERSKYATISTDSFLGIVQEFAGKDAVTLVRSWLYDTAVPKLNTPPAFPDSETLVRSVPEGTEAGQNIGAPVAAVDPDNDSLTYTLGGPDAGSFDIVAATGQLLTKSALDYEEDAAYSLTVSVSDGRNDNDMSDTRVDVTASVMVNVTNVDEAGSVVLSSDAPQVCVALRADLTDPDGSISPPIWRWERSTDANGPWSAIDGATIRAHTPGEADRDHYLRVTASYADGQGPGKTARAASAGTVTAAPAADTARTRPETARRVPPDWPLIPQGIDCDEDFRLLFVTSATRDASSADIADYNAHVRAAAGNHAALRSHSDRFTALISTFSVDAKDNTGTTGAGVPVHWLGGERVADDYADLYDGDWDSVLGRTENGGYTGLVWTGGNRTGGKSGRAYAGAEQVRLGDLSDPTLSLSSPTSKASGETYPLYALSPVFTVAEPAPEPPEPERPEIRAVEEVIRAVDEVVRGIIEVTSEPERFWTPTPPAEREPPGITSGPVIVSSPYRKQKGYGRNEVIVVAVTFSEAVTVAGEPRVKLDIGDRIRWARYDRSEQGGTRLLFEYRVRRSDRDEDGVSIRANQIWLRGGSITHVPGKEVSLVHLAVHDQPAHMVDGMLRPHRMVKEAVQEARGQQ